MVSGTSFFYIQFIDKMKTRLSVVEFVNIEFFAIKYRQFSSSSCLFQFRLIALFGIISFTMIREL